MTIYELSALLEKDIVMRHHSGQGSRWTCKLEDAEIKGDGVLIGAYGDGESPFNALSNYINRINGEVLVIDAYRTEIRKEYTIPDTIWT